MKIRTKMMFDAMSSFFVNGAGSSCINSHCDGYPRKRIRMYTAGTASCEISIEVWRKEE